MLRSMWGKENTHPLLGMQTIKSHYRNQDPVIPSLGITPKNTSSYAETFSTMVILFTVARNWKQHRSPSTDERVKKMWYILPIGID